MEARQLVQPAAPLGCCDSRARGIAAYLVVVAAKAKDADMAPCGRALLIGARWAPWARRPRCVGGSRRRRAVGAACGCRHRYRRGAGRVRRACRQNPGSLMAAAGGSGLRIRGRRELPLYHVAHHGPDCEPVPERAVTKRGNAGMPTRAFRPANGAALTLTRGRCARRRVWLSTTVERRPKSLMYVILLTMLLVSNKSQASF